jgi:hypothetical protein
MADERLAAPVLGNVGGRRTIGARCGPFEPMTDKARRMVGLVIAPLLILVGLLLCPERVGHGKMSEIFWVGPFLAVAGGLWLASVGLTFSKAKPTSRRRS